LENSTFKDMTKEFRMENPRVQQQFSHSAFQATLQRRDKDGNTIDRKARGSKREKHEDLDCPQEHREMFPFASKSRLDRRSKKKFTKNFIKRLSRTTDSPSLSNIFSERQEKEERKLSYLIPRPDIYDVEYHHYVYRIDTTKFGYRGFITDNGADTHLINQVYCDRMTKFRPAGPDLHVRSGPELSSIVGIGDAWFHARDRCGELGRF
jgi:hypothetical protein